MHASRGYIVPAAGQAEEAAANGADAGKPADEPSGELSELEKIKRRAEKFGLPMDDIEKQKQRAAKFGLPVDDKSEKQKKLEARQQRFKGELAAGPAQSGTGSKVIAAAMTPEEEEKRKKRAERFGVAEIEAATAPPAKKAKAEPEITDPKLLARAERFKAATDSAAA